MIPELKKRSEERLSKSASYQNFIEKIKAEKDVNLHKKLSKLKGSAKKKFINKLVQKDLHKN